MARNHGKIVLREPLLVLTAWLLFGLLALFVLYPLFQVLTQSLMNEAGEFSTDSFTRIFSAPHLRRPIFNTLLLGVCVASISTFIGYIFAYATSRTDIPGKKFFHITATFPMISPPFLVAFSAIILFGNNGLITEKLLGGIEGFSIYGFWGLLAAQVMAFFPTAFLVCKGQLSTIDPVMEEASLNAGASRLRTFWSVLFPLSLPGVFSSFLLVFIESLADFANPLVLSGDFKVLSVEAYLKIVGSELDLSGGAALALILLVPSILAFLVQQVFLSKKSFVTITGKPSPSSFRSLSKRAKAGWLGICGAVCLFVYLFYGTVFYGSMVAIWGVDSTLTLKHYGEALRTEWTTLRDSLFLALLATPFSGLLGIGVAYFTVRTRLKIRHWIEWTSMLTFAIPGTVVGIGYVLAFNRPPLVLQGTWAAIALLFVFRNAPVGIRAGIAALMQIDKSIDEASANLGASKTMTLRKVLIPLLTPAFFAGLSFAFVRCMNAVSAVIFVVSSKWNLITISILNFFENGELSKAAALCVILVGMVLAFIGLMRLLLPKERKRRIA